MDMVPDNVRYIGGVDISFSQTVKDVACAALVILDAKDDYKVVYKKCQKCVMQEPYIPGFLAFREVYFLVDLLAELVKDRPELDPDVIFVDGNGILHPRGFGLASHLGVLINRPTIGVGKNLLNVDCLDRAHIKLEFENRCSKKGDNIPLVGKSGKTWGVALKTCDKMSNPIFISLGHKVSLKKSIELTLLCSKYRVPEPIRLADQGSRSFIRNKIDSL